MLAWLLACAGCWEEIHYVPGPETAGADGETAENSGNTASDVPPSDPVMPPAAVESPDDAAGSPTAGDLFSPRTPADPSAESTAPAQDAAAAEDDSILPTPELPPEIAEAPMQPIDPLPPEDQSAEPTPTPVEPAATADERHLAWQAASKWSLATAVYAKGFDAARYESMLDEAKAAATEIGVELPPLPAPIEGITLEAAVVEALGGEHAATLVERLGSRFTPAEAALAELAIRSRLLLLTYSPRNTAAAAQAAALRQSAEASGLPAEVWEPLANLLDQRAAFVDVRGAVLKLDDRIAKHFSNRE